MLAKKLKKGDEVRIIAPSRSLKIISQETQNNANKVFEALGLKISFGKNCEKCDSFMSSSIEDRIEDLHEAFANENVKAVITVIGGYNSNQLLNYIDYGLIKANPKIFCGYSDTTALINAIYHKTGLITYQGPAYSTFGMEKGIDYSIEYFKKLLFSNESFFVESSELWSDDPWYLDQNNRKFYKNEGLKALNKGKAKGTVIGGNLCTLNLLQGSEYMPSLQNSILFIEDDDLSFPETFDRDLQSLIHQKDFHLVKGIVFGKFQTKSNITDDVFEKIIRSKKELKDIPIIYNGNFGHTTPQFTFPVGGIVEIVSDENCMIKII